MQLKAAVFDLDGVVTDTASVHFIAWKALFDTYLKQHSAKLGEEFREFTEDDYLRYVDGIPRFDGVRKFLESRDIHLTMGEISDSPDGDTICSLGNRKNKMFLEALAENGADIFTTTVDLIKQLRAQGVKTAIISSSRNCAEVLKSVNLTHLFEVRVDGLVLEKEHMPGKPAPDMFLRAVELLGVEPRQSLAVEDAIMGVEAAKAGGFGLVVGIDRKGLMADDLKKQGADIVVQDLGELPIEDIDKLLAISNR